MNSASKRKVVRHTFLSKMQSLEIIGIKVYSSRVNFQLFFSMESLEIESFSSFLIWQFVIIMLFAPHLEDHFALYERKMAHLLMTNRFKVLL